MRIKRTDKKTTGMFLWKIVACFSAVMLVVSGCSISAGTDQTSGQNKKDSKVKVVATLFPYYDFVRAVIKGVDGISITMTVAPGQDSHSFEPTPASCRIL